MKPSELADRLVKEPCWMKDLHEAAALIRRMERLLKLSRLAVNARHRQAVDACFNGEPDE